ncbi:prepilin-type N-terminal cleavage/methylation domain-containing protein [Mariprofundus erugo]|uniref:PilW family protein n=1 Tax=Mariprofundus erugo TaxID=2528639 RepID=UPI0010FD8B38|nr:prepilin-type N-terminal cleavage/methylation domain-containing protein [Mariprofundus erugo]TLS73681.1 prepilin-type N-terminal cleavage/methylation domain-containing protein [Mariprofundus erugo]
MVALNHGRLRGGEEGFTLIELMISMAMGLVIIAGLASVFITNSKVTSSVSSRTERMGDLYLASQLMQAGLRESLNVPSATNPILTDLASRGVTPPTGYPASNATFTSLPYWDATSKTLTYQNMEGHVGIFQYQRPSTNCPANGAGCIFWLRPLAAADSGSATFQEMMRDLSTTNGLVVSASATAGVSVTLQASYMNEQHQSSVLSLGFKIWPRN